MDSCCIDEGTISTTDSISIETKNNSKPVTKLWRMGSGTSSVVIDLENGIETESRKLPSSQYKGVVPQPNGRWGAQIYEKHQRVWLGTFNEEEEAAKAYDIAVRRFRGSDAVTNFKLSVGQDDYQVENIFLNSRSKAEIVDMLRKHTYSDELDHSRRNHNSSKAMEGRYLGLSGSGLEPVLLMKAREYLFEKAVTPSDVGKLNRLVIPKQHAEKHFPLGIGSVSKGVLLNFEDNEGKVWRFRYSYWNSSQSYVLTKGWSRFVKEKNLKAGDVVNFQRSTGSDNQLYIDWKQRNATTGPNLSLGVERLLKRAEPCQMVRLFGVNIFKSSNNVMESGSNISSCKSSKRMIENEVVGSLSYCCKKQRVIEVAS